MTIGNGTQVSEYLEIGDVVFVRFLLTFGSTTSISGNVSFNLPETASTTLTATGSDGLMGNALFRDNSASRMILATAYQISSTGWRVSAYTETGTQVDFGAVINPTNPFTWATSDYISATFWYRKA